MGAREIGWRSAAAARIALDRARFHLKPPRWSRTHLAGALGSDTSLQLARLALAAHRWDDAQREVSRHFARAERRFVIAPRDRASLVQQIVSNAPDSPQQAASRADRIVAGRYDLLGYSGLQFGQPFPAWNYDPIANRHSPNAFWADVPYLDPACGDHKVIWELNRHQHWIALGRAYWLTGDPCYRGRALGELRAWLAANPPLAGINWASMLELGFRSLSWLWALNFFVEEAADDSAWLVDLLVALDRQLAQLERNLSYYFSPNTHLLGEALALYVCGRAVPQLAASERRQALGRQILIAEIDRQVLSDGGHAERSMHYHRYTLDFYVLALVIARITGDAEAAWRFEEVAGRLAAAARMLSDDCGRLPHIGDDDGGVLFPLTGRAPDDVRDSLATAAALTGRGELQIGAAPEECFWILGGLSLPPAAAAADVSKSGALPDSGYYISRSSSAHIVLDGGPHGFRNGGHAHADALSLTMSVRGVPLLIDPGTGCYTIDCDLRDRMRSTPLHNTVTVDGRSQSLPRGPFHWEHVANTGVVAWRANDAFDYFDAAHDGYGAVTHRRRVLALHHDLVVVADLVDGAGAHRAAAHWHVDPRWAVEVRGRRVTFDRAGERLALVTPDGEVDVLSGDSDSGLGWHSPVYGKVERATTVRIASGGQAPFWIASVFDLSAHNAIDAVEWIPVWAEAGTLAHGAAIRIARAASTDYLLFAEHAAPAPSEPRQTLRIGEFETDARMLFCRIAGDRPVASLALVDGSLVRAAGRRGPLLAVPHRVLDLYLDFTVDARMAGPMSGARLVVGGKERPLSAGGRGDQERTL